MLNVATLKLTVLVVVLAVGLTSAELRAAPAGTTMQTAAERFLRSLTDEQRERASFEFNSPERQRWHYLPSETFPRRGLLLKDMTEAQRSAAYDFMKTGLSARGFQTFSSIFQLETVLGTMEQPPRFARDPDLYRFSVFGTPTSRGVWGWRVEGHHVSLHFTVVDGKAVASAPSFSGTNPAEIRSGPQKGTRILGALEDAGRALVTSLDATQRATAVLADVAPSEIISQNKLDLTPLTPVGLLHASMTPTQRHLLLALIDTYAGLMTEELAIKRLSKIRAAGLDRVAFAWAGPVQRGQKHYYRVQGPSFLIEFDNTQNDANHIHAVWREFSADFGRDVLREHLLHQH